MNLDQRTSRIKPFAAFFVLSLFALSGCSLGPKVLPGNRMDFNISLQKSNSEELLLNLVRARYFEHPLFLHVGAITS